MHRKSESEGLNPVKPSTKVTEVKLILTGFVRGGRENQRSPAVLNTNHEQPRFKRAVKRHRTPTRRRCPSVILLQVLIIHLSFFLILFEPAQAL